MLFQISLCQFFFLFVILKKTEKSLHHEAFYLIQTFHSRQKKKAKQLSQPASVYIPQHVFISYIFTLDYLLVSLFGE